MELCLRAARSGEETVRMMFETVRVVATGELTAATAFAHEIVATARSGDWLELAEKLLVPLSPRVSEADASTAQKLAWLRSDSAQAELSLRTSYGPFFASSLKHSSTVQPLSSSASFVRSNSGLAKYARVRCSAVNRPEPITSWTESWISAFIVASCDKGFAHHALGEPRHLRETLL